MSTRFKERSDVNLKCEFDPALAYKGWVHCDLSKKKNRGDGFTKIEDCRKSRS